MLEWLKGKLRWLLVAMAVAGPVFVAVGWTEIGRIDDVVARGVEGEARILSATRRTGRRGGTSHRVELAWRDAAGAERRASDVQVSRAMADRLFRDDRIVVERVRIKSLPEARDKEGVVLLDDVEEQRGLDRFMIWGGLAIGALGLLGCALMFGLLGRLRAKPKPEFARDGRAVMGPPTR